MTLRILQYFTEESSCFLRHKRRQYFTCSVQRASVILVSYSILFEGVFAEVGWSK